MHLTALGGHVDFVHPAQSIATPASQLNIGVCGYHGQGLKIWWQGWSRDTPCTTTVQGQKVEGQGHKVTHKKFTQSWALALVTLESKRPLIVVVAQ